MNIPDIDSFLSESLIALLYDPGGDHVGPVQDILDSVSVDTKLKHTTEQDCLFDDIKYQLRDEKESIIVIVCPVSGEPVKKILDGIYAHDPLIPVVIVSGDLSDDTTVDLMRSGVIDCLSAKSLSRLSLILNREIRYLSMRRRMLEQKGVFDHVAHEIPGYIFQRIQYRDGSFRYTYLSPSLEKEFGVDRTTLIEDPSNFWSLIHPEDKDPLMEVFTEAHESLVPYRAEYRAILPDDRVVWVRAHAQPTLQENGDVVWNGIGIDVTHEKYARERVDYLAYYDAVTGLPNRHLFFDRLDQALKQCRRMGAGFALHIIDLDNFKYINDTYGHLAGDRLLKFIADSLSGLIRESDTLSRIGGDEFALIQTGTEEEQEAGGFADKLISNTPETETINGHAIPIRFSIGTACYIAGGEADFGKDHQMELMRRADEALYQAKRMPGSARHVYSPKQEK